MKLEDLPVISADEWRDMIIAGIVKEAKPLYQRRLAQQIY
jgi:hypothetical protein